MELKYPQHVPEIQDIDFMNIDVEGHELHVLNSIDFLKYKIKFICIEMIDHNDQAKIINEKLSTILNKNDYKSYNRWL